MPGKRRARAATGKSPTPTNGLPWRGRSLDPRLRTMIEDYEKNNSFFHEKSEFHYTMLERGGRYFQRRSLKNKQGEPVHVHEEEITYILGSGDHARSLFSSSSQRRDYQVARHLVHAGTTLGMSPGYDVPDHLDFTRPIPQGCFFCHTSYPRLIPQRSEDEVYFPNSLPAGIGCERCHGPGSEHVRLVLEKAPAEELQEGDLPPRAGFEAGSERSLLPMPPGDQRLQCGNQGHRSGPGNLLLPAGRILFPTTQSASSFGAWTTKANNSTW